MKRVIYRFVIHCLPKNASSSCGRWCEMASIPWKNVILKIHTPMTVLLGVYIICIARSPWTATYSFSCWHSKANLWVCLQPPHSIPSLFDNFLQPSTNILRSQIVWINNLIGTILWNISSLK